MRRKDKEIQDPAVIEAIIRRSLVCRLAMCDGNRPYVVPVCFGYQDRRLYFHSAAEGKKLDILRKNPAVCFEFDVDVRIKRAEHPCRMGMEFKSVIGTGTARFIEDPVEKRSALDVLVGHYDTDRSDYPAENIDRIIVVRVDIDEMTGKQSI